MHDLPRGTPAERIQAALERFERPLMTYATRLLGDAEQARDVVQDTFLRLCREHARSESAAQLEGHLREWLFTVCRHRAQDCRKKRTPETGAMELATHNAVGADPDPAAELERKDELAHILDGVRRLPPNQQEVLRLKFQHGLSYKEISRVTELSVSHVGLLIHRGLSSLRTRFASPAQPQTARETTA